VQQQQQQGAGAVAPAPLEGPEQKVSVMAFYVGQKLDLISVRFGLIVGCTYVMAEIGYSRLTTIVPPTQQVVQHNFLSH